MNMSINIYRYGSGKRLIAVLLSLLSFATVPASNNFGYTEEHPLVMVCDWDFRPYEFIDSEGQPSGYNIDVLNLIFDKLDIPHVFVMQEWHTATDMFKNHEADLIHMLYTFYQKAPYVTTRKFINYYNVKVARRSTTPALNKINDLHHGDTLLLKKDDYAATVLFERGKLPMTVEYHSPKDALTGISQGIYKYYIWGEVPLTNKIKELGLDSIALDDIDIPTGELRIIGYNKELIDIIDDQYTRLEQAGDLQKIYDHWFHPELEHDDASPVALLIVAGLLLVTIIVVMLTRLVRKRVNDSVRECADLKQMMVQVLNMGDYFVIEWDFKSNMLRNKYGKLLPDEGMRPEEFLKHMPHDEAERLHTFNSQLAMGTLDHFDMHLSFNYGTAEQPNWRSYYGSGIVEKHHGKPQYIVYTIKDITDEVNEERLIKNDMNKYKQMFDTNLIAMSFYNADGVLLDINKKMRELCEITDVYDLYFQKSILFSFPNLKGVYMPGSREVMYVCQHLNEPLLGINKYIEFRVRPVINDDDELVYYIVTSRDITAERNMYLEQRKHDQRLQTINDTIKHYEIQLSYLLEESLMYIWSYRPAENVINITRTPGKTEFTETIEDYIETIRPDARQQAMTEVQSAMQQGKSYTVILPFDRTPLDKEPTWYSVSGIPIFNKDGQLVEYFGLSRNITSLMEAQEKLRVETARAEDSGRLKAAFLANMTHEIRTPLNAIVGFSDLLPMVEDAADKQEFMRIIRNNCDMLLRLINDILEASNIESRPLAIEPADVDFAQAFDDICQTLEQRVQEPGVLFIKDNPYSTFNAYLDKGRIQQVITNFVTNAVKYTHQGHIKVGYRQEDKNLYIYCEDTGAGIPKEKQAMVFERFVKLNDFVQGTGLGLSICKSIAERCGGNIGVESDGEGTGSTFWIRIPFEKSEQPTVNQ